MKHATYCRTDILVCRFGILAIDDRLELDKLKFGEETGKNACPT